MAKKEKRYNPVEEFNKQQKNKKAKLKKDAKLEIKKKQKATVKKAAPVKYELNPDDFHEVYTGPAIVSRPVQREGEDLSHIKLPLGVAPETDGQIYDTLQLPVIKNKWAPETKVEVKTTEAIQASVTKPVSNDSHDTVHEVSADIAPGMPWDHINAYDSSSEEDEVAEPVMMPQMPVATVSAQPIDYSKAVVQSAPQKRDLMKELVGMVPASLQRKK
jgi:hypothetical protein